MKSYRLQNVLAERGSMRVFAARSERYAKNVIVKVYQCSGIESAAPLIKSAIQQVREKRKETAVITDVLLEPVDKSGTDIAFTVNFIFEKKAETVSREILERYDTCRAFEAGLSEYEVLEGLPVHSTTQIRLGRVITTRQEVIIKSTSKFEVIQANPFIKEAIVQAYIDHERNCRLIDICFTKSNQVFDIHLVMERMQEDLSVDMSKRLKFGRYYTEMELLCILRDVTEGLLHAKLLRIAHRDIKPSNIFLDKDMRVKLGDFGCAWMSEGRQETETPAGTLDFMSPEMRDSMSSLEPLLVNSFASDVYSLGVTLLNLALLVPPLDIESRAPREIEWCFVRRIDQIRYSKGLKLLIMDMVTIEAKLRIKLETVRYRIDILLNLQHPASLPASLPAPLPAPLPASLPAILSSPKPIQNNPNGGGVHPGYESEPTHTSPNGGDIEPKGRVVLCNLTSETLRFYNFKAKQWEEEIRLDSKIMYDEGTSFALENETVFYFGNCRQRGCEAGKVTKSGQVSRLKNMNEGRTRPGGIVHSDKLYVFGGFHMTYHFLQHDYNNQYYSDYYRSGEVLGLPQPSSWTLLGSKMSEGKIGFTPVLYNMKFYMCGYKNIDIFNIQALRFDLVLPLQIPYQEYTDCIAVVYKDKLIIVTREYWLRVKLTNLDMSHDHHEGWKIDPRCNPVLYHHRLYWICGDECQNVNFRHYEGCITF